MRFPSRPKLRSSSYPTHTKKNNHAPIGSPAPAAFVRCASAPPPASPVPDTAANPHPLDQSQRAIDTSLAICLFGVGVASAASTAVTVALDFDYSETGSTDPRHTTTRASADLTNATGSVRKLPNRKSWIKSMLYVSEVEEDRRRRTVMAEVLPDAEMWRKWEKSEAPLRQGRGWYPALDRHFLELLVISEIATLSHPLPKFGTSPPNPGGHAERIHRHAIRVRRVAAERIGHERLGAYCDRVKEAFEAYVRDPPPPASYEGWGDQALEHEGGVEVGEAAGAEEADGAQEGADLELESMPGQENIVMRDLKNTASQGIDEGDSDNQQARAASSPEREIAKPISHFDHVEPDSEPKSESECPIHLHPVIPANADLQYMMEIDIALESDPKSYSGGNGHPDLSLSSDEQKCNAPSRNHTPVLRSDLFENAAETDDGREDASISATPAYHANGMCGADGMKLDGVAEADNEADAEAEAEMKFMSKETALTMSEETGGVRSAIVEQAS